MVYMALRWGQLQCDGTVEKHMTRSGQVRGLETSVDISFAEIECSHHVFKNRDAITTKQMIRQQQMICHTNSVLHPSISSVVQYHSTEISF